METIDEHFVRRLREREDQGGGPTVRLRHRGPELGSGHAAASLRRPGAEPTPRLRGALAPGTGQGLLHDRLGRSRVERGAGTAVAGGRPRPAALPLRRLLRRSCARRATRQSGARRPAQPHVRHQRPDVGWAAQGVRTSRAEHHPADLHDQLTSSPGGRACVRPRRRRRHGCRVSLARGRRRAVQLRGRVGQPLHRRRGAQRRELPRAPQDPVPRAVRVRGQRHRDQHQVAQRVARERRSSGCPG